MEFFVRWAVDGCLEVIELIASRVGYDNSTSGLASSDVQGAIDEIALFTGAAAQFSFQTIKAGQSITVPDCQQMLLCDEFCVEGDGELIVDGSASVALI